VQLFKENTANAPLDDKEKALLLFVLKALENPHSVTAEGVENLRELGLSDQQIFDAVNSGATMRAGNILFDAFKVEVDY